MPPKQEHYTSAPKPKGGINIVKKNLYAMAKNKKLIRELFRNQVFERDGYKCKMCEQNSDKLDAHHITDRNEMPNGGYVKENGISLCPTCHLKAEQYHISQKQDFVEGYHPDGLYAKINSSFEKAWNTSEKL